MWIGLVESVSFGQPKRFEELMEMPLTAFFNQIHRFREKEKRFTELAKDKSSTDQLYFLERWKSGLL